jgi:murein DD-endopeptidase MepM/ murein hydrolase activator NlpD
MAVPILLLLCLGVAMSPAGAQGDVDPETQRQQNEQRQQEIAGQLDVLKASDEQLKAELDKLDVDVHANEAKVNQARADLEAARAQIGELERQVVDAEQAAAVARRNAADRAVAAYMRPDRETASQVLAAKDPQQLAKMHAFMTDLAQYNHSVLMTRVYAEQDLKNKKAQAEDVHERADHLAVQADADLAEVTRLRDRQVVVRTELDTRITGLKDESEALEAQEAELSAIINARHAAVPDGGPEVNPPDTVPTVTTAPTTVAPTTIAGPTTTAKPGTPTTKPPSTTVAPTTTPPTTKPPGGPKLSWPVSGPVTSPFGSRWGTFHKGIDIGVGMGTPIHAAAAGTVFFSGVIDGYGNVILIDHGKGMVTLYAHQSQLIATQGSFVSAGQTIGLVGSTGHSTGPHLHFEVRINNVAVDPMGYLP